jgi:hypothetical protein
MPTIFVDKDATGYPDGTTWENAYLTIDDSMNNVQPGDLVLVAGNKTYTETAFIDTIGSAVEPIIFQGDDQSNTTGGGGIGNPALVTIDGEDTRSNGLTNGETTDFSDKYYTMKYFSFINHTGDGVTPQDRITYYKCQAHNNNGNGLELRGGGRCIQCYATGNQLNFAASSVGGQYIGCVAHSHNENGNNVNGTNAHIIGCTFWGFDDDTCINVSDGNVNVEMVIVNNIIVGNNASGGRGIFIRSGALGAIIANNIIVNCDTGISSNVDTLGWAYVSNNLFFGNTNDTDSNIDTGVNPIFLDPLFVDAGSNDYRLLPNSPAVSAGFDAGVIDLNLASPEDAELSSVNSLIDLGGYQKTAGGSASNYLETQILTDRLTTPTVYLALFSSDPGEDASGSELSGDGYARTAVSFGTPSGGAVSNDADVVFPFATTYWPTVTHFGVFDASSGGNMLVYGVFNSLITILAGERLRITSLIVNLD